MSTRKPSEIYRSEKQQPAPSTSDLTIVGEKVPTGKAVLIETFFAIDQTTANKTLRLGYDRGGTKFWIKRAAAGSGIYGLALDRPLYLVENEAPAIMIESPTTGDVCLLVARGEFL